MLVNEPELIDWSDFEAARQQLGADFARILQYFREDGSKSVDRIEAAMRDQNTAALVVPAHTLKGESMQFGAYQLSELAETIEMTARKFIETRQSPEGLVRTVAALRGTFERTLAQLEDAVNPLVKRRVAEDQPTLANQKFGRL